METKARFRSFLAALALFCAFGGLTPLDAQSPDEKEAAEPSKDGAEVSEDVPPIPEWTPSEHSKCSTVESLCRDLAEPEFTPSPPASRRVDR